MKYIIFLFTYFLFIGCSSNQKNGRQRTAATRETFQWFDKVRNREIPVAIYTSKNENTTANPKIVIINHGYGQNKGGDYLAYSYIAEFLAENNCFVISIQHELASDSLIQLNGNPQLIRRPFWDRGADNILFVINKLKQKYKKLDFNNITLIGHSNGGDMAALFPQKYPNIVHKLITLDNRRMALPRTAMPKVLSLRSSDMPADEGVLPTLEEQKKYEITIIKLANTIHNNMDDNANEVQRKEINNYIISFLKNKF